MLEVISAMLETSSTQLELNSAQLEGSLCALVSYFAVLDHRFKKLLY